MKKLFRVDDAMKTSLKTTLAAPLIRHPDQLLMHLNGATNTSRYSGCGLEDLTGYPQLYGYDNAMPNGDDKLYDKSEAHSLTGENILSALFGYTAIRNNNKYQYHGRANTGANNNASWRTAT